MSGPQLERRSKQADPNHRSQDSFITLLSAGALRDPTISTRAAIKPRVRRLNTLQYYTNFHRGERERERDRDREREKETERESEYITAAALMSGMISGSLGGAKENSLGSQEKLSSAGLVDERL